MELLEKVKNSCEVFSDKKAFCIDNKFYTYTEFNGSVATIKNSIENNFDGKNKTIGVLLNDDFLTYTSIFAILFSGNAFVPINPANPIERNINIIEQAEIELILSSKQNNEFKYIKNINTSELISISQSLLISEANESDLAYILFTSGSTGLPKGVPISRKSLDSFINAFFQIGYNLSENDKFLQMFELTFDLSIMSYMIPLSIGACVYPTPTIGIKYTNIYTILEEHEITVALMVPSILAFLRPYFEDINLEKLRYSLFCGEALYSEVTEEWSKCVPNALIQNVYGPTEATIFCLTYDWNKNKKSTNDIISIGKPMNGVSALIVNEDLQILLKNEKGELCLSGNQLTSGYIKNIEKNKESFFNIEIEGKSKTFYRTGDICFVDEDGDYAYCSRKDNQIKIQGFRVELSEIEFYARKLTGLTNVAAIPKTNNFGNIEINLFIENSNGHATDLIEKLKSKVPEYMIPSDIISVQKFPFTQNGKIDRKALIKMIIANL